MIITKTVTKTVYSLMKAVNEVAGLNFNVVMALEAIEIKDGG